MMLNIPFVDLVAQYDSIRDEIDAALSKAVGSASFVGGPLVDAFEEAFADYCGAKHCVGVGNGTDALYLALRCLGIGPGDEVIVPANTFIATSEAVTMTGGRVVFADCNPSDYTLDVQAADQAVTGRTRAIVPVHLYGRPADLSGLQALAERHGLFLVEDAAQAHGAEYDGRRVGTFGHAACFSFYPGKNLGAYGDAGAVVTDDEALALRIRRTANHGRIRKYEHEHEGVNSRMDGLQAAVLSAKLGHLDEWNRKRRELAERYRDQLAGTCVPPPDCSRGMRSVYHLYVIRTGHRDRIREMCSNLGISTGIHYPVALPNLKAYSHLGYVPEDTPVASQYAKEILSLPLFPELGEEKVDAICRAIREMTLALQDGSDAE